MKRRTPILATVVAAIIATLTVGVAQAVPDTLALDAPTTGHITGTVTSDQPYVFVWFDGAAPADMETLVAGSANFDLPTWGYSGSQTVHAVACPTTTNDNTCSPEQTATFTPTDVSPAVTWFSDSTVGPGGSAIVTVSDPTGGGTLRAVWDNTDGADQTTVLDPNGQTPLTLVDGTGTVTVQRCSTVDPTVCTGFTPAITHPLTVRTTASASLGTISSITTANPSTTATVDTNRDGTYTLEWHLEQLGNPIAGTDGTDNGTLDGTGTAAPFTIPGAGLADGTYDVVGTITVTDPSYGVFPAAAFSSTVTVDSTGAPLFSPVDASTAGHVTGTVSSLRPYVFVWFDAGAPEVMKTLSGGSAAFDLATWGYTGSQMLHAVACPTTTHDVTCSAEQTTAFTVTDVAPVVTWYSDPTVGPGQSADVHVEDPTGGGSLHAVWDNTDGADQNTVLPAGATTSLSLVNGTGIVTIMRCSTVNTAVCTGFNPAITQPLTVRQTLTSGATASPISGTQPDSSATVTTNATGTYSLAWHLEQSGTPVGPSGTVPDVPTMSLTAGATNAFTIPGAGLAAGTYDLVGTITVIDPTFGTFTDQPFTGSLIVDRTPPVLTSIGVSVATIYPLVNSTARPGSTLLTAVGTGAADVTRFQLKSATTTILLTADGSHQATWYGRVTGASIGAIAPAGAYTVTALDLAGNPASVSATVTLSGKKLVLRTFTRTASARSSLVGKYVGRCSVLRQPSLRGWAGSLGFYSNTRCNASSFVGSGVSTENAIFVPNAESYLSVRVDTFSGAATSVPASLAVVRYLKPIPGKRPVWVAQKTLGRAVGTHAGRTVTLSPLLFGTGLFRSFHWGVATGYGNRYDVRKFTVVIRYYVLG